MTFKTNDAKITERMFAKMSKTSKSLEGFTDCKSSVVMANRIPVIGIKTDKKNFPCPVNLLLKASQSRNG
ncbi:hypothetical protein BRDCF_p1039 [Bacteroidales bacterium CF]|nr:hypothetical protein BRDCF_p1039 [Bacteroidales bacterium CF]